MVFSEQSQLDYYDLYMDPFTLLVIAAGFVILLILTQDLHIFPGVVSSKLNFLSQRRKQTPPNVESLFIKSSDGVNLEVWHHTIEDGVATKPYIALICHGNGGPVEAFLFIQMWLAEQGIPSYSFDYRGFGRSGGWPSEKGIYRDSDAVWEYVRERENIKPENIIVVGISVGSAPAARIAATHHPKLLMLISAFKDLRSTVRAQPIFGLLAPFVWSKFPTMKWVQELDHTHLLIAHGLKDNIVPAFHSEELEKAYSGSGELIRLTSEIAGHNMTFYDLRNKIGVAFSTLL